MELECRQGVMTLAENIEGRFSQMGILWTELLHHMKNTEIQGCWMAHSVKAPDCGAGTSPAVSKRIRTAPVPTVAGGSPV